MSKGAIRIYVACLASYNAGILYGRWIHADQEEDVIRREISEMLAGSPVAEAEEYAIHGYEGFEGASVSEHEGIDEVAALAAFVSEHGELGGAAVAYYGDVEEARRAIEEHYAGSYRSVAAFAEEITEETADIPDNLRLYIDYDRMARDLEISDVIALETGFEEVHIIWQH